MAELTRPLSPSALAAIGTTPLVPMRKVVPPGSADVLIKLEYL